MTFIEITKYLAGGSIVRSEECEYKTINGVGYWRWIGEEEWSCIVNDSERKQEWKIVR